MRKIGAATKPVFQTKMKSVPQQPYTVVLRQGQEAVTYRISSKTELLKCVGELAAPFMTDEITIIGGAKHG